jgi:uncharacterized membrane protein YqhA
VNETTSPPDRATAPAERVPALVRWLFGTARLVMLVGIASLIAAATTLLLFGAVSTYRHIAMIVAPAGAELTNREVFLASIKLVDLVLLATVLEVVAIGLFALFIDSNIPVPSWLKKDGVDGLKNKLAGIVVVMLGVLFLEQVITSATGPDLLPLGIAIGIVIVALSYFIRAHRDGR